MRKLLLLLIFSLPAWAQPTGARPQDVTTIDAVINAYYDVISGPPGQARDWARDANLYIPGVRFVAMGEKRGKPVARVMTHQEYVEKTNDWLVKNGFYEKEIHRETRRFGNIVQVWSTYESRQKADGPVIARGINSLELYWDGTRWWVASAVWEDERPDNPIPRQYLP